MGCLMRLWTEAGCSADGSRAPATTTQEQLDWWNARTGEEVIADMELYHQYATEGREDYASKCFGPGESGYPRNFTNMQSMVSL